MPMIQIDNKFQINSDLLCGLSYYKNGNTLAFYLDGVEAVQRNLIDSNAFREIKKKLELAGVKEKDFVEIPHHSSTLLLVKSAVAAMEYEDSTLKIWLQGQQKPIDVRHITKDNYDLIAKAMQTGVRRTAILG